LTALVKKETDIQWHRGLLKRMVKAKDFKKVQKDHNPIEISGMKRHETLDSEKIERLRIPTALMLI
jgi:hypothetical protein